MNTIHKYDLPVRDGVAIDLPKGAGVLSVQSQHGQPDVLQVWAVVDTAQPPEPRWFRIYGTGHPFDLDIEDESWDYVGTVIVADGALVWHVFEVVPCLMAASRAITSGATP